MDHRLRPASASDKAFLYELHCTTMRGHIERTWGWDENWQRFAFEKRLGQCAVSIIEAGDSSVGALWLEFRSDCVYVADLQIMPEWQGCGIGSAVLRDVLAHAARCALPVDLAVLPTNDRARRLYERLGFRVTRMAGSFVHMRWAESQTE